MLVVQILTCVNECCCFNKYIVSHYDVRVFSSAGNIKFRGTIMIFLKDNSISL